MRMPYQVSKYTIEPAQKSDLAQILEIYIYYVLNTTISLLIHEPTLDYISSRYEHTIKVGLPYLVAISNPPPDQDTPSQPRHVLGYIHASSFSSSKLGYAPSVELTLYIHHEYINHGIGKALLQALITALQTCEYRSFEAGVEHLARSVKVRNLYAICSQDLGELDEAGNEVVKGAWEVKDEKTMKWYRKLGFSDMGRLVGVGEKFGRDIDVAYLCMRLD